MCLNLYQSSLILTQISTHILNFARNSVLILAICRRRSTRNSIFAENELKGFNLRANSAKTLLTNVVDIEEDFWKPLNMSGGQTQTSAMKSLLKSALDMEEDFHIPPNSNDLPEHTLTKSLLKGALDMEEDFQTSARSPNTTNSQPVPNLDLDYDFRMCNIVNPETARLRRSLPKTASLLRFSSLSYEY